MDDTRILVGRTPATLPPAGAEGAYVDLAGERFFRISTVDTMTPFLMSLASDSDHWLFVSSTGALTAGRGNPDRALFPYTTDDRIHDARDRVGGKSLLLVHGARGRSLWEPFSERLQGVYRVTRNLYKNVPGNVLVFEEVNHDLELSFRQSWQTSERFGFVRTSTLSSQRGGATRVEVLDGVQNLLPPGIGRRYQMEFSTLADGYKDNELDPETGLGLFRLSSVPTDQAEPSEALRASTVWCAGVSPDRVLLSARQLDRFRQGRGVEGETRTRGVRGAYLVALDRELDGGGELRWRLVAEVDQGVVEVVALRELLRSEPRLADLVAEDVARGTENLVRIVANADGLQLTRDERTCARHFANTFFNIARGGVFDHDYRVPGADFRSFVARASRAVAERQRRFLAALPGSVEHGRLRREARAQGDPDLERLAGEYLPLTFSRRHGDPSRPWNLFAIEVKDEHGNKVLRYQGNWRDIFQNWEALALSFPGYLESMIFRFVNGSTADGFNPYRVTRDGFEWEVPEPENPWSNIGYWGDHQIIYLLKLLELSASCHPGALEELLARDLFVSVNVPYRIKPYEALLADPRHTIEFDESLDRLLKERMSALGSDGCLWTSGDDLHRVNLCEKLLVPVLAKLSSFIPEAGIWMNTQRPEWNDANNALVGYGVSMVTLCHLRRFLAFARRLFARVGDGGAPVSDPVARHFEQVVRVLRENEGLLAGALSDRDRRRVLDGLGRSGSEYRRTLYGEGVSEGRRALSFRELVGFCELALSWVDHTIRANRRPDGMYHAYNLMSVTGDAELSVRRLTVMLEGQVAALSSGLLAPAESVALLDALARSDLYREDKRSYVLYPDRALPRFLEKNVVPREAVVESRLLSRMLERGDRRIVEADAAGAVHFAPGLRNARLLKEALAKVSDDDGAPLSPDVVQPVLDLYERVFDHQSFTGRSGTFYKYEGLGCIYWHMVSKLALAVQESLLSAKGEGAGPALVDALLGHYVAIREGLGVHDTPAAYGAFPTDPYSHTPGFAGVQQPGMTGQVKEDLISRLGEMGVRVEQGRLHFDGLLLGGGELLEAPAPFRYVDLGRERRELEVPAGALALTFCQVPVVVHGGGGPRLEITGTDGAARTLGGLALDAETSSAVLSRDGSVARLDVYYPS
jgi:hypothetical protein